MTESRPRYRSIFWPLILIAAGVLWLLGNFNVISGSNLYALVRLWPVLLIAVGLDILLGRRPLISTLLAVVTVGAMVGAVIFAPQLGLAGAGGPWFFNTFPGTGVVGSGNVVQETRSVSDFDSVRFGAYGELTIRPGATESLVIEADDNLMPYLKTEVRGGRLEISVTGANLSFNTSRPIRYTLTVKSLKELIHSGAGNVEAAGLSGDDLNVQLTGAGNVTLTELTLTNELTARLSGAGNLTVAGTAARQDVELSGFGEYRGGDLKTGSADIRLSGAGSGTVWATEQLNATLSGAGSVRYYGQPAVDKRISGVGNIESLGSK